MSISYEDFNYDSPLERALAAMRDGLEEIFAPPWELPAPRDAVEKVAGEVELRLRSDPARPAPEFEVIADHAVLGALACALQIRTRTGPRDELEHLIRQCERDALKLDRDRPSSAALESQLSQAADALPVIVRDLHDTEEALLRVAAVSMAIVGAMKRERLASD